MKKIESIVLDDDISVTGNLRDGYSDAYFDWHHDFILTVSDKGEIQSAYNKKYIKEIHYE